MKLKIIKKKVTEFFSIECAVEFHTKDKKVFKIDYVYAQGYILIFITYEEDD